MGVRLWGWRCSRSPWSGWQCPRGAASWSPHGWRPVSGRPPAAARSALPGSLQSLSWEKLDKTDFGFLLDNRISSKDFLTKKGRQKYQYQNFYWSNEPVHCLRIQYRYLYHRGRIRLVLRCIKWIGTRKKFCFPTQWTQTIKSRISKSYLERKKYYTIRAGMVGPHHHCALSRSIKCNSLKACQHYCAAAIHTV